ncbi:hypothetical protein MHYP_G00108260 [Metynnis hypsauchen]
MVWYKQKVGQTLQQVGIILTNVDPILSEKFKQSGIQLKVNKSSISLTIPHTTKDDEGTYFCGLSHANVIKFSTGTFLSVTARPLDPVVICLGAAFGVCVVVISVQTIVICKQRNREQCSAEKLKGLVKEKTIKQDEDAEELNYAALNFHERKTKRGRGKREQPQEDTLYSAVRRSCVNDRVTH